MTAGGKRSGAGRPKGAKTLWPQRPENGHSKPGSRRLIISYDSAKPPWKGPERRFAAAEACAPYLHPKLSTTHTNVTGLVSQIDVPAPEALASKFAALNDRIFSRVTAIANAVAAVPVSKEELDNDCD